MRSANALYRNMSMNYDAVGAVPFDTFGKLCGAEYMYVGDVPL